MCRLPAEARRRKGRREDTPSHRLTAKNAHRCTKSSLQVLNKCNSMALSTLGHAKNHCEPISCACCSLSFISESLCRIRYPLMEGRGAVCQGPVTFWTQLYEVKSTHYQSRSPQKQIGSCLKLAVAFILSALQMEADGWLLENCFSSETEGSLQTDQ